MLRSSSELTAFNLILFIGFILFIRSVRFKRIDIVWGVFAIISFGYFILLLAFHHYPGYLVSHNISVGTQGRYLFIVMVPAYLLLSEFLLRNFIEKDVSYLVVMLVGFIFLYGDFPYFLQHMPMSWRAP